jgi:hypothetical protein
VQHRRLHPQYGLVPDLGLFAEACSVGVVEERDTEVAGPRSLHNVRHLGVVTVRTQVGLIEQRHVFSGRFGAEGRCQRYRNRLETLRSFTRSPEPQPNH